MQTEQYLGRQLNSEHQMPFQETVLVDMHPLRHEIQRQRIQLTHILREEIGIHALQETILECNICSTYKNSYQIFAFCCTHHAYCKGCIFRMIQEGINEFKIIKCPEEGCPAQLDQNSPYYDRLKESEKKRIEKIIRNKMVLSNPEVKLCRKEECNGILKITPNEIKCELCQKQHCLKCYEVAHQGKCDKQTARCLQKRCKFKRCPNCKMIVQKNNGCNHITCYCTFQFCYVCGQKFELSHQCNFQQANGFFSGMRMEVYRENSDYNSCFNCSKILELLEPDFQRSIITKYIMTFLVCLTVYPALNSMILSAILLFTVVYLLLAIIVVILYIIFLPLLEIRNLQLPISLYLLNHNIPEWLVRFLALPLYPINFFFAIRRAIALFECVNPQKVRMIRKTVGFFAALPCLMLADEEAIQ